MICVVLNALPILASWVLTVGVSPSTRTTSVAPGRGNFKLTVAGVATSKCTESAFAELKPVALALIA